ncbi:MAG: hypothetical protein F6K41_41785, partial [Symploca sp. SIO3E6]|nr:hypothetical protein [Caldora sp. SIO3E6]
MARMHVNSGTSPTLKVTQAPQNSPLPKYRSEAKVLKPENCNQHTPLPQYRAAARVLKSDNYNR